MKSFKKRDIERFVMCENFNTKIYKIHEIKLREDVENKNAYVEPTTNGSSTSMSGDIAKAKTNDPSASTLVTPLNNYDSNQSNNPISLDVKAATPNDAANKIKQITKNPAIKQLQSKTPVNANVHLESIDYLRENSVKFTKNELKDILKKRK